MNDVRYTLFYKSRNIQSHQLPPTRGALAKHIQRANYQTFVWKNALEANPKVHDPCAAGWIIIDGALTIYWTDQPLAPDAEMELVSCGWKGQCQTQRCTCVRTNLPCSDACICGDQCLNRLHEGFTENDDSDEDGESDGDSESS